MACGLWNKLWFPSPHGNACKIQYISHNCLTVQIPSMFHALFRNDFYQYYYYYERNYCPQHFFFVLNNNYRNAFNNSLLPNEECCLVCYCHDWNVHECAHQMTVGWSTHLTYQLFFVCPTKSHHFTKSITIFHGLYSYWP